MIQIKSGQKIAPYALAGYELGLILSHRGEPFAPGATPGETDVKSDTKNLDFGLVAGAGIEFKLERVTPFIELRYHHGLSISARERDCLKTTRPSKVGLWSSVPG